MNSPIVSVLESESTIDYDSYITKLIFTGGCNFKCSFCHNYKLVDPSNKTFSYKELGAILTDSKKNWIDAICITGGEPTIHKNLSELIDFIRNLGFRIKLDTNGSKPEVLKKLLPKVDYFAMDYKSSLANYQKISGSFINTNLISESRDLLIHEAADYEFRTTIIPGFHDKTEIRKIAHELTGAAKYILQPFVPQQDLLDNDYIRMQRTDKNHLNSLLEISKSILKNCSVIIR
jgi:pyruvate formate lyase activating enzyme